MEIVEYFHYNGYLELLHANRSLNHYISGVQICKYSSDQLVKKKEKKEKSKERKKKTPSQKKTLSICTSDITGEEV